MFKNHVIGARDISIHALVKRATAKTASDTPDKAISIHALVKRATSSNDKFTSSNFISIHALVKRATSFSVCVFSAADYFNPRPREEGD